MNSRKKLSSLLSAVVLLVSLGMATAVAEDVVFARHVAVSPDGAMLAFSWAGDVWTVPITGGAATRLTVHPGHDDHPVWSPDGRRLAFSSDRHGASNVFLMERDGSGVGRLTFSGRAEIPTDWSLDGDWIYFYSRREGDTYREPRMYRVPVAGGQSWRVADCFGALPQISPDGERIAFVRGSTPWGRRGYRGSASFDVYVYAVGDNTFSQVTDFDGTDKQPVWDAEGRGLYFLSDRGGTLNVWYLEIGTETPKPITHMTGDDVREFSISADGRTLAFTHWDAIYVMTIDDGLSRVIEVTAGDDQTRTDVELQAFTRDADEVEASLDGKEIALVVHGEIFVVKTEDDKPTRRVTDSPARDHDVVWSPDGKALFFVSDREGQEDLYRATSAEDPVQPLSDSLRFTIERITDGPSLEYHPRISPDGEKLGYVRGRGDLIIRDLKTGEESVLLESWNTPAFRWSPDSKWIAYENEDVEHNSDIWVVPADGSAPGVNISQHPDYDGSPQWSADGQMLAFTSQRHGFDADLYVVFLSPELDEKSAVELDEYFEEAGGAVKKRKPPKSAAASGEIALAGAAPESQPAESQPVESQPVESQPAASQPTTTQAAPETPEQTRLSLRSAVRGWLKEFLAEEEEAKKPAKDEKKDEAKPDRKEKEEYAYELDTSYRRIRRVTSLPGDQSSFAFAPGGQVLAFRSSHEGTAKLYTIKWNGTDRKSILGGSAGALHWGLNGKKLYYLRNGVPNSCSASGSGAKAHAFRAKMAIAQSAEAAQKFDDGARQLGLWFYDPAMKGLDWPALARKYRQLALKTHTLVEFNSIFNMLLGELNASHLGIYGPGRGGRGEQVGQLGCRFDRVFAGPGLKVAEILPRSPADRAESKLVPGDILLRVNGQPVGPDNAIEEALVATVGDEVIIEYIASPNRKEEVESSEEKTDEETEDSEEEQTPPAEEDPAEEVETPAAPADVQPEAAASEQPETETMVIRPISMGRTYGLRYDAWVAANAAYVAEQSGGRVGYLHIRSMDVPSFEVFERDLYAAAHGREGLIIDVRNNGGGWTADWVMAVLNVQRHAYTVQRGGEPGYPQGRLIFYAWTKPTAMMCNQHSFSNAEIVSHAFKNLERGPLVGMTTHGGVISTGGYHLVDGALVRMPMRGWYTLPEGVDMELNGAEPDVKVLVRPADEVAGRHPQLDAAIDATLAEIEKAKAQP